METIPLGEIKYHALAQEDGLLRIQNNLISDNKKRQPGAARAPVSSVTFITSHGPTRRSKDARSGEKKERETQGKKKKKKKRLYRSGVI